MDSQPWHASSGEHVPDQYIYIHILHYDCRLYRKDYSCGRWSWGNVSAGVSRTQPRRLTPELLYNSRQCFGVHPAFDHPDTCSKCLLVQLSIEQLGDVKEGVECLLGCCYSVCVFGRHRLRRQTPGHRLSDMAPSKSTKQAKVFHPDSRKAAQLARTQLRKNKLSVARSQKTKKLVSQADVYGFFYHALPPEGVLSLQELHSLVRDAWLTRHDHELEEEKSARRKGRPKSMKEVKLEEIKLRESEEYRTGMEVLDLTHTANVELFRKWDQTEAAYVQMLRFIRITSTDPTVAVLSRPGRHPSLRQTDLSQSTNENVAHVDNGNLMLT